MASDLCSFTVDNSFYNLQGLYDNTDYYSSDIVTLPGWKVVFNFCKPFKPLNTNCDDNTIAAVVDMVDSNNTLCFKFAEKV